METRLRRRPKRFSMVQKGFQHLYIYFITMGALQAIIEAVPTDKVKERMPLPFFNALIFGPGLVILASTYESLWLFSYKKAPWRACKELINGNPSSILKMLLKRMAIKSFFILPANAFIAFLQYYKQTDFKNLFFRNITFYGFPTSFLSLIGEWVYEWKYNSFYSGSSIAYHLASQINSDVPPRLIQESNAVELTASSYTADSDVAFYQHLGRLLDNITIAISLAEIFFYNGLEESNAGKEIFQIRHLFLMLATTFIFFMGIGGRKAFTPFETVSHDGNEALSEEENLENEEALSRYVIENDGELVDGTERLQASDNGVSTGIGISPFALRNPLLSGPSSDSRSELKEEKPLSPQGNSPLVGLSSNSLFSSGPIRKLELPNENASIYSLTFPGGK